MEIYEEYFRKYDKITASKLVSKPGSSEHQLGLGVDLTSQSVVDKKRMVFGDSDEYKWVIKNAHKYGFIFRYRKIVLLLQESLMNLGILDMLVKK
ncbi:MAG: D-alanyl-D-alanine carboxypeptidase family protein [Clostridia bacterium]